MKFRKNTLKYKKAAIAFYRFVQLHILFDPHIPITPYVLLFNLLKSCGKNSADL